MALHATDLGHADHHRAPVRLMRRAAVPCALLALAAPWLSGCGAVKPSPTKVEQEPGTGHIVPAERPNVPDLTKR